MVKLQHFFLMLPIFLNTIMVPLEQTIPLTGLPVYLDGRPPFIVQLTQDPLELFIEQVAKPQQSSSPVGLFHPVLLQAEIIQQPKNAPGFVSTDPQKLTQFSLAGQYGVTALLAHNYLMGQTFFKFQEGDILTIVYGDKTFQEYQIEEIRRYQALTPNSPYSKFVNLADPDKKVITATDLFYEIYTQKGTLVLQTCIEKEGELSWGRIFIIARPIEAMTTYPTQ
ncbi:hypothetical protein [Bellilinea sp.]|uniref:hypothetical protein n=1 Tax=Bellilinea sp. TaxID=2838785 RepID=UPI002ADD51EB|nr:hypothetical protein [Bellilinea sp.]